jgi:hypothetical protein
VDLAAWVEDQQRYELGEISKTTGLMKTTEGWVVPPHAAFHNNQENQSNGRHAHGGGSRKRGKPNSKKNRQRERAEQEKYNRTHKQTAAGNRSKKNNTPWPISEPLEVRKTMQVTDNGKPDGELIGTLRKGEIITKIVSMARAEGIDCLQRLIHTHNRKDPTKWSKNEGNGWVDVNSIDQVEMKLHYYCYDNSEIYEPKPGRPRRKKKK